MKPGDIVNVFADAERCRFPQGQARLIKKLDDHESLEQWSVEYLDYEGYTFNVLIKPISNGEDKIRQEKTRRGKL